MIQIGFGLEFGDDVCVAEGLSLTCVHDLGVLDQLFPSEWPSKNAPLGKPESGYASSLLEVYFNFAKDEILDVGPYDPDQLINTRLKNAVATPEKQKRLRDLVASWDLSDLSTEGAHKLQIELGFLVTMLTSGTSRPGKKPRIDFFLMHLLTSSIFVPSFLRILDDDAKRVFIQGYLLVGLQIAMSRGKPKLFPQVIMGYTQYPAGPMPLAAEKAVDADKLHAVGTPANKDEGNPWLRIVDNALVAHDSHVPKSIRSLVFYAQHAGDTPKGGYPNLLSEEQVKQAKNMSDEERRFWTAMREIDGTIFVRGAGVIMDVLGWTKEGTAQGEWDRSALGWDGAWDGEPLTDEWRRADD